MAAISPRLINRPVLRVASALTLALGGGLAAPLALAGAASAAPPSATAEVIDGSVVYTAADGQVNKVTITADHLNGLGSIVYVIKDVVPIDSRGNCSYRDSSITECDVPISDSQDPYPTLKVDLGDGNDTLAYTNSTEQNYNFASTDLGTGNDTLTEASGLNGNYVDGGAGNDTLTVGEASVAMGGDGNDTIHAGKGTLALGNKGNDTIFSTGFVDGGVGSDVISGGAGGQSLNGGDGADKISGGTGNDRLYGGKGNDTLHGNSGNDTIYGNSGNDKLYGGPGRDTLSGGPGRDTVRQD
ncbi:calcium-binding protein [Streptomyces sp. NPDC060223]|uniref:calcium-binding protein n=1 Tax=unclassified Streptomyces TaxID=2593676 RepID=UPI00363619C7